MKPARLRLAGLLLLSGVALGGAAAGGYALGAASSKPRAQAAEVPRGSPSEDIAGALRQIDRRLSRLEGSSILAPARGTEDDQTEPGQLAAEPAEAARGSDDVEPAVAIAPSDPELLLVSQRAVEAGLAARGFTEAQKATLRQTLPKLALEDRLAVMNQLGMALNRGEIEFDAHEVF
jgi:hypothetical protein